MKALVTGGARSGKSGFAERLCMSRASRACYIATAQAYDMEMKERIALHRVQRESAGYDWQTLEEAQALPELLQWLGGDQASQPAPMVLVDCLTLWLSNVLLAAGEDGEAASRAAINELAAAVEQYPGQLVIVTNEVGDGIVPEYPLGRLYRDLSGVMNQRIARLCGEVFLVTAGIPVELKQLEYKL
ncbi:MULTISPECIES: bifunctional adenosylcobinamide kinase/adenosylcobinamide-phosphate guanylyltransferase [Paenibacillus]|uniref:bifunctional adenosylcobinamide kinase/adenosylcobinamide-phosphate guanylyltransferase n=1 Tax=Paenibacillus TaxID=44249 RepID=UPI000845DF63|nr:MULTISPECIES: bifunctional adenosylcobinamide kinase/adenosylcobinamide-phosphate guanylyltransferase [Paenibacillus]AOK91810.1 bifunctional adenosylcobinamide kinase/adenosylcobinamide-phosphate guanylyltransferase [Paenibacillus polymyxa]MCP3809692.1 bifunctional adenosylcobinamide kinase/adenosylcobinamide-phosphate guanylyltransferase [Paenibacillus sp. Lou8.1]